MTSDELKEIQARWWGILHGDEPAFRDPCGCIACLAKEANPRLLAHIRELGAKLEFQIGRAGTFKGMVEGTINQSRCCPVCQQADGY